MTALPRASLRTLAFALCFFTSFAAQAQIKPALIGTLTAGAKTIQGIGDPAAQVFICVTASKPTTPPTDCSVAGATPPPATFTGSSNPPAVPIDPTTQLLTVTLTTPLAANSFVYLIQKTAAGAAVPSPVVAVADLSSTNEREQTDFVGGTLLNASGGNYSQASLFLALNYDRTLWRPGWYRGRDTACLAGAPAVLALCPKTRHPGLNTFFQARLTTIPVNASSITATSGTTTPASTSVSSFLAQQKSAQFGGGIYAPLLFGKVPSNKDKNQTFYVAPIARFGFSTPAGSPSGSSSTASSSGTTTTTTTTTLGTSNTASGQLYNYGLAGMRIATADLNPGALHTTHYFDVGVGKYSNLQSLVCEAGPPATACLNKTTGKFDPTTENRVTLFRLEFEGFLEIISANNSSLILGISANTGPGFLSSHAGLDTNNRAAENINFLIGYKFDVSQLLGGISIIGKNP